MIEIIPARVGDVFELEYLREDGTVSTNLLPYVELEGEPTLLRDHGAYLKITPDELTEDLRAGALRGHRGVLRRMRVAL